MIESNAMTLHVWGFFGCPDFVHVGNAKNKCHSNKKYYPRSPQGHHNMIDHDSSAILQCKMSLMGPCTNAIVVNGSGTQLYAHAFMHTHSYPPPPSPTDN